LLALGALAAFLARHPLRIVADDRRQGRRVPRTRAAWMVAAAYALAAAVAVAGAAAVARQAFWPFLLAAGPLAAVTVWYDSRGESRHLVPELAGAAALGVAAGASGLAGGLSWPLAASLWTASQARVLPAIVTVRERVRRLHGQPPSARRPALAHGLGLAAGVGLGTARLMPWGVTLIAAALALRAAWQLRPGAPHVPAMRLGVWELVTGLIAAAVIGATYW
jgi:hypothetical protein